ncbi:uncharacterized protein LOC127858805 [Dreissena polymorpha]|uniref:Uncharacterized protein n=1 Tax=Dreissena polymorpha TaxID=45954 RepID=A0A9D3YT19_DREPO|nr:uncharacterized protein LOC127858805 [Dreissena polymorpha]KAH3706528.1 hypothetical protein DPMN_065915 [Dreissena polymorpha]
MSSSLRCSLCLALCGLSWLMVEAINPASRLKVRPLPVPALTAAGLVGPWFVQSHLAPCSWQGSSEFTDWQTNIVLGAQPGIKYRNDVWRMHGTCTHVPFTMIFSSTVSGKLVIKDPIGDVLTGEAVVIGFEPNAYIIMWGCTKPSVIPHQCADPWLTILTRDQFPLPTVWNNIDMSLMHVFGLRLADIPRVKHTTAPCVPSIPHGVKG